MRTWLARPIAPSDQRTAASTTLSVYNLTGGQHDGYGGRLSGFFPVSGGGFVLQPAATFRYVNFDTGGRNFEVADVSLRAMYRPDYAWNLFGGVSLSRADDVDRVLAEVGVTWRF